MKILYILQNPDLFSKKSNIVGGHIAHIVGVIEAFQRLGHEIIICALSKVPHWENNKIQYRIFRTNEVPFKSARGITRQFQITRQIIQIIPQEKPEFIYVRWAPNLFFGRIRRQFSDLPIVVECNDTLEMPLYMRSPGFVEKQLFRMTDRSYIKSATLISAVSQEIKNYIVDHHCGLDEKSIITNANGVDTERFSNVENHVRAKYDIPAKAILIGWAGNFRPWHNLDFLIRVFKQMASGNTCLLIIGTGPEDLANELRKLSGNAAGVSIIFTGPVPFSEMPAHLSACDVLVASQTTSADGTFYQSPIKLYEYMAVGKAIVGAKIGQIPDVIQHEENGLLYEYDSEASLLRALKRLITDRDLRLRIGAQARKDAVGKHSWDSRVSVLMKALAQNLRVSSYVPN